MIHLLKGNLGPGVLNIPEAFLYAGLYVGALGVPLIGIICLHCMQLLVSEWKCYHLIDFSYNMKRVWG